MHILHINSYFSTSGLFSNLYEQQINQGISINVYVPIAHEYPEERLASNQPYADNIRTFNHRDRWIFNIKHQKILKDLINRYTWEDIDLIHAHSLFSNGWLAQQIHREKGIPYLVAVRNADIRTFFGYMPWMRKLGINILKDANQIVFISKNSYLEVLNHYIPQNFRKEFIHKATIIPNGVDEFWLNNRSKKAETQLHRPLRIVSTGKVMGLKRFPQLATMLEDYYQNIGPVELHIIGPDWNPKIVEKLMQSPLVKYHGPKTKEELLEIYRTMDIFAMLSSPETFGLVYVEAMSQGLPVIYTKGEGFDGYFPDKYIGVSVDKTDQAGLSQAIAYIVQHYKKMSLNAHESVTAFNWQDIHQKYLTMYQDIIMEESK